MKDLLRITFFAAIFFMLQGNIFSQEKYAVIITGDYADLEGSWATANGEGRYAMEEFWNDTYLMWETLIFKGYDNDNIFVLFANNVDYYHDNNDIRYKPQLEYDSIIGEFEQITDYKASKENVLMVLTGMADGLNPDIPQLTEDDFLYVYTFGHGYHAVSEPSGTEIARTFLCLMDYDWDVPDTEWDEEHSITDIELADLLDNVPANKKLVVMQQCSSGGFIEELAEDNVIISTAANDSMPARTADEIYYDDIDFWDDPEPGTAHAADEFEAYSTSTHEYTHGEYNLHFISSINGKTPDNETTVYSVPTYQDFHLSDADNNNDNIVSITEAFDWIILLDSWRAAWGIYGQGHDDPQLSHSNNLAKYTSLEYPTLIFEDIGPFGGLSVEHRGIIGDNKGCAYNPLKSTDFFKQC